MGALSNYLANKILDHVFRKVTYTPPTDIYVALYKSNPTKLDTGTEVTGDGYARQKVTFSTASNGKTANTTDITFPEAESDWGTITHVGLRDALTGGNLLKSGAILSSVGSSVTVTIAEGDQIIIKSGKLEANLD